MRERMEEAIFGPPILTRWHKIGALNKENHHLVDWKALKGALESATNYWRIWATQITAQELPTGSKMNQKSKWPLAEFPRGCGYQTEDITHILQCSKSDQLWYK